MYPTIRLSGSFLSQAASPLTVVVVDPRGTPFSGAQVTLQGQSVPQKTDSHGVALFPSAPSGEAVVQIQVGDFTVRARGSTDQTLFVTVPVCAPGPLLTNTEIVALLLGVGATAAGLVYQKRAAEMLGEILVGSSLFSAVYRHSCRW